MPITLSCTCGKALKLKDELAGRRVRCPACSGVLVVPAPEEEIVETVVTEDPDATADDTPRAADDRPADERKKKKKKKKRKAGDVTPLSEREKREQAVELQREKEQKIMRIIRSSAFLGLGVVATIGAVYALITYSAVLFNSPLYLIALVFGLVVGLASVGKGILGLVFGQEDT